MMKYCIMRECENILRGYLYDGDLVFVILKGISIFKLPNMILEISSRDLTFFAESPDLLEERMRRRVSLE
jgi:hypothetical protein